MIVYVILHGFEFYLRDVDCEFLLSRFNAWYWLRYFCGGGRFIGGVCAGVSLVISLCLEFL